MRLEVIFEHISDRTFIDDLSRWCNRRQYNTFVSHLLINNRYYRM